MPSIGVRGTIRKACPSLPIITSTGSQHHGTSKPNEMHARMNMPTGAATRRDIYQRMLEKIRPYFTKERFARALLGIFCALMASPLSAQARGLRVSIFDFELIDTSLEGATNGPRADETARQWLSVVRLASAFAVIASDVFDDRI